VKRPGLRVRSRTGSYGVADRHVSIPLRREGLAGNEVPQAPTVEDSMTMNCPHRGFRGRGLRRTDAASRWPRPPEMRRSFQGATMWAVWPFLPVVSNAATRTVPRNGIAPRTSGLRAVGSLPSVV
jgi:hypothetical protein